MFNEIGKKEMCQVCNTRIVAIASNVPQGKADNLALSGYDHSKLEKIVDSTGVRFRHVAKKGEECTSDLCFAAAERIVNELEINRSDIGILIFVSQSGDYILPATACILQNRLGLQESTLAFDINLGCSGYPYGIFVGASLLQSVKCKYALILVGDTSSFFASPGDQSTFFLFGDAGTATLLEYYEDDNQMQFSFGTDGSGADKLIIKDGGYRYPFSKESIIPKDRVNSAVRADVDLYMDGMDIFSFAISRVVKDIKNFMDPVDSYDGFVFHQANKLMIESMRKLLKIPKEKFLLSLYDYGNTSSATIPATLCHVHPNSILSGKYFITGFGVGLSWASASLKLYNTNIFPIEEGTYAG